jgi:hypothetical protein
MKKKLVGIFVCILLILTVVIPVSSTNKVIKNPAVYGDSSVSLGPAWTSTVPHLDGVIVSGEWAAADKETFALPKSGLTGTFYIMNDAVNIYIGLTFDDPIFDDGDLMRICFDNDNDGLLETGDDSIFFSGKYGYSDDVYLFPNTYDKDVYNYRTNDGTGIFLHARNLNQFEICKPLDSSDDGYDFSLNLGDTVGFSLAYASVGDILEDNYWPGKIYGPATTWGDITIADFPNPPNPSSTDLEVTNIEVSQAVQTIDNNLPLVQKKITIARVYVNIGPISGPIDAEVHLYVDYKANKIGALKQIVSIPYSPDRGNVDHTANFLLEIDWTDCVNVTFKAFVKPKIESQAESSYKNNWMFVEGSPELLLVFEETFSPDIHVVFVNIKPPGDSPETPTYTELMNQLWYLDGFFPLAKINYYFYPWTIIGAVWTGSKQALCHELEVVGVTMGISYPHQIYGLLPEAANVGGVSFPIWCCSPIGIAACGDEGKAVMAHEIIHNLGTYDYNTGAGWGAHSYEDADWPYPTLDINEFGTTIYKSSPLIIPPDMREVMSGGWYSTFPHSWISPYRWEKMYHSFISALYPFQNMKNSHKTLKNNKSNSLIIPGWINKNENGSLDPIYHISPYPPIKKTDGNCSIKLINNEEEVIFLKNFEPMFVNIEGEEEEIYCFNMLFPYYNETKYIELNWGSHTIDRVQVSNNDPVVQIISPNGGEIWEDNETIIWEAWDPDHEDNLTFRIFYSSDGGESWIPCSGNIEDYSYDIDSNLLSGSENTIVKVIASDGFNNGYDTSDGDFTIPNKPPIAIIMQPEDESQFFENDIILLQSFGMDVDDINLLDDDYSWSSDIDGFLGLGQTITTKLQPGNHKITLTVTDNDGVKATDEINIIILQDIQVEIVSISGGFGVSAVLDNYGSIDLSGMECIIETDALFMLLGKEKSFEINIPAWGEITISTGFILGFGPVIITVTVEGITKTATGFVIGPFVLSIKET